MCGCSSAMATSCGSSGTGRRGRAGELGRWPPCNVAERFRCARVAYTLERAGWFAIHKLCRIRIAISRIRLRAIGAARALARARVLTDEPWKTGWRSQCGEEILDFIIIRNPGSPVSPPAHTRELGLLMTGCTATGVYTVAGSHTPSPDYGPREQRPNAGRVSVQKSGRPTVPGASSAWRYSRPRSWYAQSRFIVLFPARLRSAL